MSKIDNTTSSVQDILNQPSAGKHPARKIWLIVIGAILIAVIAGRWWLSDGSPANHQTSYQTEAVKRGDLKVTVTATGNLQPLNQVDIGTELSGTIDSVLVDNNDQVKKGQELARLNTTQWRDTVTKNRAALAAAEANVKNTRATVQDANAPLKRLQQLKKVSGGKLPSQADMDTAIATLERALADEAVARTNVDSAKAELSSAETNLGKATITSPIDGVVLDRAVEPGQTVAASLSAPILFTLAEDLSKMELEVSVDEADVGQVKEGQEAEFTVDAWPGRKYPARITRVSLGATTTDNVVSYLTVLAVKNSDLSLRPGMTATATITTHALKDALLVPNPALRFKPAPTGDEANGQSTAVSKNGGGFLSKLMPRPPRQAKKRRESVEPAASNGERQQIWVLENDHPIPVSVTTGVSDGRFTEIVSGDLQPGAQVITGSVRSAP